MPKPARRLPRWLLVAGTLALSLTLICGLAAIAIYFWLGLYRTNQVARIVPANTVAFVSVSPTLWQLPHLRQVDELTGSMAVFAPLALLPGVAEVGQLIADDLPLDTLDIDPVDDILPWIGREVSLAVIDIQRQTRVKQDYLARPAPQRIDTYSGPPLILAAVTRNQARLDAFLTKVRIQLEQQGITFEDTIYQDVPVTQILSPANVPLAYATFNGLVVLATDTGTLRNAIDTAAGNGSPALTEAGTFQETLATLPANRLGYLYLNVADLSNGWQETEIWQLKAARRAGAAVSMADGGVRFHYALHYDVDSLTPAQSEWLRLPTDSVHLAGQAPANSLIYLSGHNLPLAWETVEGGNARETLHELRNETGIDFEGLLRLISAEYACVVTRDLSGFFGADIPFGLLLLARTTDQQRLGQELATSLELAAWEAGLDFYRDEINQTPVWLLEDRFSDESLGYGFLDDTLFIGTSKGMIREVTQANGASLADNNLFQAAVAPLPNANRGYLYVDVQQSLRLAETFLDEAEWQAFENDLQPYMQSIQAIAATTEPMDRGGVLHGVLFVLTEP